MKDAIDTTSDTEARIAYLLCLRATDGLTAPLATELMSLQRQMQIMAEAEQATSEESWYAEMQRCIHHDAEMREELAREGGK
jgi:hypothetical protein